MNHQIEKLTKIIYFIVAKVGPVIFVWPKGYDSLYAYATTASNREDTLKLAYPMW